MIKVVFRNEDFIEPNIGDRFIIHKPENVFQRPGWVVQWIYTTML